MLAKVVKSLSDIDWPNVTLEPKIDGIRMGYCDGKLYSRSEKGIYNADHILKELNSLQLDKEIALDGELYAGSWERTMSLAKSSKTIKDGTDLKYIVFDVIDTASGGRLLYKRKELLNALFSGNDEFRYIKKIASYNGKNYEFAKKFFEACQAKGYEGIMIKDLNAPYVYTRSSAWLKFKSESFSDEPTRKEMDCVIIGASEGYGKYVGTLGALIVRQSNGEQCSVSGMTDKQRDIFWKNRHKLRGKIVEVLYQELSNDGVMRFPVFSRLRSDK
jgi:ATP-dependent DNA ligase